MNANEQLVEDLFELFIMRIIWGDVPYSSESFEYTRTLNTFIATKEQIGREKAGVVVYVSDNCKDRIYNNSYIDHIMKSEDGCVFYRNKVVIQLVEDSE